MFNRANLIAHYAAFTASADRIGRGFVELVFSAESFATVLGVVGWSLVTSAVALVLPPAIVWRLSGGVFCLTLFGWGFLAEIGRKGLYALTRKPR